MHTINTIDELEAIYGQPLETATIKDIDHVSPDYAALIAVSPFVTLATVGADGLDCSPRGDRPGFVRVHDPKTLMLPDRRGNNRIDSLRNIVADPRVALLFLIPGVGTTLRVNGRAELNIDPDLLSSFAVDGKAPRSVLVIAVDAIYFQCARAIVRSEIWNPDRYVDRRAVPTPGQILADLSDNRVDGRHYDQEWPARAKRTLW